MPVKGANICCKGIFVVHIKTGVKNLLDILDKYSPLPVKVRIGTLPFIFQLEILSSIKAICLVECRFIEILLSICFVE